MPLPENRNRYFKARKKVDDMTNSEICKEFREAKNQKLQIGILADRNLRSKDEIIKILIKSGEDLSCMKPKEKKQQEEIKSKEAKTLPDLVLEALYEKMEQIDKQITEKENEYRQIVAFIQNYGGQQA